MKCRRCNTIIKDIRNYNVVNINTRSKTIVESTTLCNNCLDVFKCIFLNFLEEKNSALNSKGAK